MKKLSFRIINIDNREIQFDNYILIIQREDLK